MLQNGTQREVVELHARFIDTALTQGLAAPKAAPADEARQAYDAIEAGAAEVVTDKSILNFNFLYGWPARCAMCDSERVA